MTSSPTKGKILVIRGGAIGDFILTLPAIAALRRQFPEAHLEVLGYPHIAQLALVGGLVTRVQPIEARGLAGFFARDGQLASDLVDYFSEFDLIVSYLYDPDDIFRSNVGRCCHGQFIQGPHRPDEKETIHATRVYLKPLERVAIFDADPVPRINLAAPRSAASQISRVEAEIGKTTGRVPTVALHPGSGSERKNWPESNWTELLRQLVNTTQLDLLLVGGEAEGERLRRLAASLPSARTEVAKSLPLIEVASRLQSCVAFVGHDSGITHVAAALGLPSLVLWADTVEEIWRPQGSRIVVAKEIAGLHNLSVQKVADDLMAMLK